MDYKVIRVVGAAILRADSCLVTQRSESMAEPLQWEFPGGKVEPGESPRQALAREIDEELALTIDVGRSLGLGVHAAKGRRIELEVFVARILSGEIELREHRSFRWIRAPEIDRLDWAAADRPILPALAETLEQAASTSASAREPLDISDKRD